MMPARFLHPCEVLKKDIQYFQILSADGNRYLLVVVVDIEPPSSSSGTASPPRDRWKSAEK